MSVNAFYSPNSNTMIVPIGMLQDPLYWSQPKSLTFGAFGIVVGRYLHSYPHQLYICTRVSAHEITHAFDDSGINYDGEGRAAQLYDNATLAGFMREAECLRAQYSQYSIAGSRCQVVQALIVRYLSILIVDINVNGAHS